MRSFSAGLARHWLPAGLPVFLLALLAACGPANVVDVQYKGTVSCSNRAR